MAKMRAQIIAEDFLAAIRLTRVLFRPPQLWVNPRVKIGGFLLGDQLKEKFNDFTQFTADERPTNPSIRMHAGT